MEILDKFPFSIRNNVLIGEQVSSENEDINIGELILNTLKSQPNFIAQVDAIKGKEITFQEIRNKSVRLAIWMKLSNIRPGDEIIISSDHYAVIYVFFASLFISAIPTFWHEKHTFETVNRHMFDAKRKMMFIDDILATAFFDDLLKEFDQIVVVFGIFTAFMSYDNLESKIDADYNQEVIDQFICTQLDKSKKNIATILYTRGASSISKPVDISHATFTAAVNEQVFDMLPAGVGMWVGSLSSLTNLILVVYSILWFKRTIRFMGYRKEEICQTLEKTQDWVLLETYMCRDMVSSNLFTRYNLSSLKMLMFTGSRILYDDRSNLIKSLPKTSVISLYATTETGIISCQVENGKMTSSGYVGKNVCVKIVEQDEKNPLGPYQWGEICCKCDMNIYHDYNNLFTELDIMDEDGWHHTGDMGYFDEDGDIFVLERIEDIIIFKYAIISPSIIENVISRNSAVETVAVVAVADEEDYEHPIAFISTKPRMKLNIQELMDEVGDKLHNCMRLRGGVELLLEMPCTLSGNIDRALLRERANEYKRAKAEFRHNIFRIQQY